VDRGAPDLPGEYFSIDDAAATPRPDVVPPVLHRQLRRADRPPDRRAARPTSGTARTAATTTGGASATSSTRRRVAAGRDPADIESCVTVAGDLPESDAASEQWLERLAPCALGARRTS
jgi:hypothetical protein